MRLSTAIVDDAHNTAQQAENLLLASRQMVAKLEGKLGGDGTAASEFDTLIHDAQATNMALKRQAKRMRKISRG